MVKIVIATENERNLIPEKEEGEIIVTGVGGLNVIEKLKDLHRDTKIINYGYCGSAIHEIGQKVKIGSVRLYHPSVDYDEPMYLLTGDTLCLTSNDFVTEDKRGDCVYDMELAYILALGFKDVESIKTISDNLNYKQYEDSIKNKALL